MLGVLANSGAVLVGGIVGLVFRGRINEKYTSALMAALALVSLGLGIICVVGTGDTLCLILCVAVGTLIGELLRIDDRVEKLGALAEKKLAKADSGFAQAFVSCSILFCVGSMAVMGSINAGIDGDNSILYAKAVLDLVASLAFGAGLGAGGVLLLGLSINLLGLRQERLRVANMLPAVFLPIAYLPLSSWLGTLV